MPICKGSAPQLDAIVKVMSITIFKANKWKASYSNRRHIPYVKLSSGQVKGRLSNFITILINIRMYAQKMFCVKRFFL